jgi:hypothetical protein
VPLILVDSPVHENRHKPDAQVPNFLVVDARVFSCFKVCRFSTHAKHWPVLERADVAGLLAKGSKVSRFETRGHWGRAQDEHGVCHLGLMP